MLHHQRHRQTCTRASPACCSSPGTSARATRRQILQELQPAARQAVAGAQAFSFSLPPLPGSTGGPPVQFVITTARELPRPLRRDGQDQGRGAARAASSSSPTATSSSRTPQVELKHRPRQGQPTRHHHAGHRRLAGDAARRQLRQPVQSLRPQLPGHPAGAARVPADAGRARPATRSRPQRGHAGAALDRRSRSPGRCSPNALTSFQQLNSATFSARAVSGRHGGRGHRLPAGSRPTRAPRGLPLRLPGRESGSTCRRATRSSSPSSSR